MGKVTSRIEDSGLILNLLLVIGFLGIVWLMIYGNLSGNLGIPQSTAGFANETIRLTDVGAIPAGASGRTNAAIVSSSVVMTNASTGELVEAGNYTVTNVTITNSTAHPYGNETVNVSYTVRFDGTTELRAESVIINLTEGTGTFFGFSNTFFTITAIVLLITILLGLLAIVLSIAKMTGDRKKGKGFSGTGGNSTGSISGSVSGSR